MAKIVQILDELRRRKSAMKIKLSKESVGILNAFVRTPQNLPLMSAGIQQQWRPVDVKEGKRFRALQKWLEEEVMQRREKDDPKAGWDFVDYDGSITSSYADLVKEILKFYQNLGLGAQFVNEYLELTCAFEGKSLEYDSPAEVSGPKEAVIKKE